MEYWLYSLRVVCDDPDCSSAHELRGKSRRDVLKGFRKLGWHLRVGYKRHSFCPTHSKHLRARTSSTKESPC